MKCIICDNQILYFEIYGDWYYCDKCDKDHAIEETEDAVEEGFEQESSV